MATPEEKLNATKGRVNTHLKGTAKIKFFSEVIKTGISEAQLARKIIAEHYDEKPNHMRF
ncbi:MAG: hypothetical protein IPN99_13565 [Bacteroidetes bacterium]|nr:hypothetical protein [Bacteroidota bacterium]